MAENKILGIRRAGSSETFRSPKTATVSEIFGCDVPYHRENASVFVYRSFQRNWKGDDRRWDDRQGTGRSGCCSDESLGCRKEQPITLTGFIPLNGATAEKQWRFVICKNGKVIEAFRRPDAGTASIARCIGVSNGGIRNTFEARGYTAWDPGSPAFINNTLVYTDGIRGLYGRSP